MMDIGVPETPVTALLSVASGVCGWLVGRRKRNNDFLSEQQQSIGLLAESNNDMVLRFTKTVQDVVRLREENAELQSRVAVLKQELALLKRENEQVRQTVAELQRQVRGLMETKR